jgi:glutathionylspermidine synthase
MIIHESSDIIQIDKEKYKSILDEMLTVNRKQPENKSELEEAYNALNQMFLKATQEVIPKKKSKKKKKPKYKLCQKRS